MKSVEMFDVDAAEFAVFCEYMRTRKDTTVGQCVFTEAMRLLKQADCYRWAISVLDAIAQHFGVAPITPTYVQVISKVNGAPLGYWRISVNGIRMMCDENGKAIAFPSADEARFAAAIGLWDEAKKFLSLEQLAVIGECP